MIISKEYTEYILKMLKDMTKEEILNSDSDEKMVYLFYHPLDLDAKHFKEITEKIINNKDFVEINREIQ